MLGFPELGMEAIYEDDLKDMPVTMAVYVNGEWVHKTGRQIWKQKIELKIFDSNFYACEQSELAATSRRRSIYC